MNAEDLKKFCGQGERIGRPWSLGDQSFATNGHILIRIPRLPDVAENPAAPGLTEILNTPQPESYFPLNVLELPPVPWCEDCGGTDKYEGMKGISYANGFFQVRYLRLLKELLGCEIGTPPDDRTPAWFKFEGGDGLIMPMRK